MRIAAKLPFLGLLAQFCFSFASQGFQEEGTITITDPAKPNPTAVILKVNPLPKFTFSLAQTLRIRKTAQAAMYDYNPKKPGKPYRHLVIFLELLERETGKKLPKVDVMTVTSREFLDITEVNGIVWTEPLADTALKPKMSGLLWFAEEDVFKIFIVNFKDPARVLTLEQFFAHLVLLEEWEASVRSVSPEDTEVLVNKRLEEWKNEEGRAYALFNRVSGNWRLLNLDWPPVPQRPRIFSVPLPWPPWPTRNGR